ncbi:hypothetical protein D3C71_1631150 [compost metagenome]
MVLVADLGAVPGSAGVAVAVLDKEPLNEAATVPVTLIVILFPAPALRFPVMLMLFPVPVPAPIRLAEPVVPVVQFTLLISAGTASVIANAFASATLKFVTSIV